LDGLTVVAYPLQARTFSWWAGNVDCHSRCFGRHRTFTSIQPAQIHPLLDE
jgi:hypothetical protein